MFLSSLTSSFLSKITVICHLHPVTTAYPNNWLSRLPSVSSIGHNIPSQSLKLLCLLFLLQWLPSVLRIKFNLLNITYIFFYGLELVHLSNHLMLSLTDSSLATMYSFTPKTCPVLAHLKTFTNTLLFVSCPTFGYHSSVCLQFPFSKFLSKWVGYSVLL